MPRGRTKGDYDGKRAQIADAACVVFLRIGLARASLADISGEMGYTTGVIRHYFVDKNQLLLYVKNRLFDRMWDRAALAAKSCKGLEKLRAMVTEYLPVSRESIDTYKLLSMFNGNAIGDAELVRLQHSRNERHIATLVKLIAGLQKEGELPKELDAKVEAMGILALIDGLGEQQIVHPRPYSRDVLKGLLDRHIECLARRRG